MNQYKTIVLDPPWHGPGEAARFERSADGKSTHSLIPYSTMTGISIAALHISELATPDAQLWIWATNRSIADANLLMELWGFSYRALFIWQKPGLGMGRHARSQCEFLLWGGRKGARIVEPKRCPHQIQTWANPKAHSEKPAEAYEFIANLSDGPRLDIFARQHRPGFDAWGNQVPAQSQPEATA